MTGAGSATGRVFVTRPLPAAWLAPLREAGLTVDVHEAEDPLPTAELHARVAGAAALWVQLTDRVDAALLDAAGPALRVVATYSVGTNHIDAPACRERGVVVVHTPDVLTDATADLTLALLLAAARRLPEGQRLVASGAWRGWAATQLLGMELRGRTLGIVGLGRIGAAVAQRARAFGMRIAYHQRTERPEVAEASDATFVEDLDRLVSVSDVLTLHAPLTPATRHLLDARRLALLPAHALLINAARGPLVDEGALVAALRAGRLAGAGLDVYEEEPRVHPGLLDLPNVVLAPHLGSATVTTRRAMADLCSAGILTALAGGQPANALT
jgi:glyoxylate reductase